MDHRQTEDYQRRRTRHHGFGFRCHVLGSVSEPRKRKAHYAIDGAAPNRSAKDCGRSTSPISAKTDTTAPPAINRTRYSPIATGPGVACQASKQPIKRETSDESHDNVARPMGEDADADQGQA